MDFFEIIQICGCFLELAAALADIGAGTAGYQLYKEHKKRKRIKDREEIPPPPQTSAWPFLVLAFVAILLTSLVVWKYVR